MKIKISILMILVKSIYSEPVLKGLDEYINTEYIEYTPFVFEDESYIIFESNRPSGKAGRPNFDLWISKNVNGIFQAPENLGAPVNTEGFEGLPSMRINSKKNWELYFTSKASENRPGPKKTNLYYSERVDGKWLNPVLLNNINTDYNDRMPSISKDGLRLYFSSDRPGGFGGDDLYIAERKSTAEDFANVKNLGKKINSEFNEGTPSIFSDNNSFYFSSNRNGGEGGYDIYYIKLAANGLPPDDGKIINPGAPINTEDNDEYPTVTENTNTIYFSSNRYGGKGGYDIYSYTPVPENIRPQRRKEKVVIMSPAQLNLVETIYFDFDSYQINEVEYMGEIAKILNVMYSTPQEKVYIGGYTDPVGTNAYNIFLSKMRANSLRKLLIKNGIASKRIEIKWFGKDLEPKKNNAYKRRIDIFVGIKPSFIE